MKKILSSTDLKLKVTLNLTLSHQGPNVPRNTMSNSTRLSYLAGLLPPDRRSDKTAGAGREGGQIATIVLIYTLLEMEGEWRQKTDFDMNKIDLSLNLGPEKPAK